MDNGPYIVILQYAKAEIKFGEVEVSNTLHSSRLIINEDIDAINEFRMSITQRKPDGCLVISQVSSQSSYSLKDDFVRQTTRKTLDDIHETTEVGKCIVFATIKSLVTKSKWWYSGCSKCNKVVVEDSEMWFYSHCNSPWPSAIHYYKIAARVMDDTDSFSFIAFGREAERMLSISVDALIHLMKERGQDPCEYPAELDRLIDRKLLFKVNIKYDNLENPGQTTHHIQRVCVDSDVISAFTKHYGLDEKQTELSVLSSKILRLLMI